MAADGVVDFRDASLLDRRWDLRLRWLTAAYVSSKRGEVAMARHMRYTSALSTEDSKLFDKVWKLSGQSLAEFDAAIRPWLDRSDSKPAASVEDDIALFKRLVGDMDDPVFRAKMEALAESIGA